MNGEKHIKGKNSIKVLIKNQMKIKRLKIIYIYNFWIFEEELILDKQYTANMFMEIKRYLDCNSDYKKTTKMMPKELRLII